MACYIKLSCGWTCSIFEILTAESPDLGIIEYIESEKNIVPTQTIQSPRALVLVQRRTVKKISILFHSIPYEIGAIIQA